jgi:phage FluMu protein Com
VRDEDALRCCCGSLLARLVEGGVELKCRRCKRQIIIPLTSENDGQKSACRGS